MRYYFLVLISFFITSTAASQSANSKAIATEKEIETFLDFYRSISELEVSFHQEKKIKDMSLPIKSKGLLRVQKPDKVTWAITEPSVVTVSMDSKEIRIESGRGEDKTTQIFKKDDLGQGKETQSLRALSSWMQMDPVLIAKDYVVSKMAERQYLFEPKQKDISPFDKLLIKMSAKKYIESMTMYEKSGDILEITFAKPKVKTKK